jgi:hypothetical protein
MKHGLLSRECAAGGVAKKATVEGSLVLTVSSLVRKRALVAGAWTSGSCGWTYDGEDKPHATIGA